MDGNGTIDYIEFITATMHRHRLERDEHLYKAFCHFDTDNSGLVPFQCHFFHNYSIVVYNFILKRLSEVQIRLHISKPEISSFLWTLINEVTWYGGDVTDISPWMN